MSEQNHNLITIFPGDSFPVELILKNPDMSLVDLTGYTAVVGVSENPGNLNWSASLAVNASGAVTGEIGPTTTTLWVPGKQYRFQVRITAPNGQITTIWSGRIIVEQGAFA